MSTTIKEMNNTFFKKTKGFFILTERNFPSSDYIYQNGRPAKNQVFFSQPKTLNSGSP